MVSNPDVVVMFLLTFCAYRGILMAPDGHHLKILFFKIWMAERGQKLKFVWPMLPTILMGGGEILL